MPENRSVSPALRIVGATIFLSLMAAYVGTYLVVQYMQHTPNIPTEQQPNGTHKTEVGADQPPQTASNPPAPAPTGIAPDLARNTATNGGQGNNDATEFWIIFWHKVKITDSLLVVVTFLLFIATAALIFVGIDQAKQLRATITKMDDIGKMHAGHFKAHVVQASRAAKAMEDAASGMHASARQMGSVATEASKTANAAAQQARAIVGAEIAKVLLVRIDLIKVPPSRPVSDQDVVPTGQPPRYSHAMLTFQNVGRTRGTVTAINVDWKVIKRTSTEHDPILPPGEVLRFRGVTRDHFVIPPERVTRVPCDHLLIELSESDLAEIKTNHAWLWVFGYFNYTNILEDTYEIGYAAYWEAGDRISISPLHTIPARGFVRGGPDEYWFERVWRHDQTV
jgi:hypothetical protein